ncbi:hypothetical protein KBY81_07745 [Cyanobium sp. Lug-B]|nr:hypothetical protein [Cyanobium sp. Lug-B]
MPTLMPRWEALELSDHPRPLDELVSSGCESVDVSPRRRALAVIHAFYPDRLKPLLVRLAAANCFSGIVVTTDTAEKAAGIEAWRHELVLGGAQFVVEVVENRGRDVLPFWKMLQRHGSGYDLFLKLHLKRSPVWDEQWQHALGDHDGDAGWAWTEDICRCLIPSSRQDYLRMERWMTEEDIGAIYPRPFIGVRHAGWGSHRNLLQASDLLQSAGISDHYLLLPLIFPAGNMFWGVVNRFLPFAAISLNEAFYPEEPLADDGTPLHAMERSYSALLASQSSKVGVLFPVKTGDSGSCPLGLKFDFNHPFLEDRLRHPQPASDASSPSQTIWIYLLHLKEVMQKSSRGDRLRRELEIAQAALAAGSQPLAFRLVRRVLRKLKL